MSESSAHRAPTDRIPRARTPRYRSSWGVDYATARRFGYPIRRITVIEELEIRVDAIEAALSIGTVVDLDGPR